MAEPWHGPRPAVLDGPGPWRNAGDTVERLEALALRLVSGEVGAEERWQRTRAVLDWVERHLRPAVMQCGAAEMAGLLAGLDGRLVMPGPSGAPSRGRPEVLPTGRNFYSVDTRAVPTQAAWQLGWKSAALLLERHAQEHGSYPARVALSAWGTANMRTGGDDVAQALALMGVQPVWERASGRVTGFEIMPASVLDRPRVDVTLRVSGFFRDAFPGLIDLIDSAVRAVAALDEPAAVNPLAARVAADRQALEAQGVDPDEAAQRAGYRIFGVEARRLRSRVAASDRRTVSGTTRPILPRPGSSVSGYAYGAGGEAASGAGDARSQARRCRRRPAQPGQPRARFARQRRLLPVRGRARARRPPAFGARCRRSITTTIRGPRRRASAPCARRSGGSSAAGRRTRAGSRA